MEIFKNFIKFLGTEIGNGTIKLQPYISKKKSKNSQTKWK